MALSHTPQQHLPSGVLRKPTGSAQRQTLPTGYRCELCGDALDEELRLLELGTEHCADCVATLNQLQMGAVR
jgi:hypothetical protein